LIVGDQHIAAGLQMRPIEHFSPLRYCRQIASAPYKKGTKGVSEFTNSRVDQAISPEIKE